MRTHKTVGAAVITVALSLCATLQCLCDTAWKDPVNGRWAEVGNWTAGLPAVNNPAKISIAGSVVTVTVDTVVQPATNLTVSSTGHHTVDIVSGGGLKLEKAASFRLERNADLVVRNGGSFLMDCQRLSRTDNTVLKLDLYSSILVDGGSCVFTNMYGWTSLGDSASVRGTNTIVVNSGRFAYYRSAGDFRLYAGSSIRMTGGEFVTDHSYMKFIGGEFDIAGGVFDISKGAFPTVNYGTHAIRGTGVFKIPSASRLSFTGAEGHPCEVSILERGAFSSSENAHEFRIGSAKNACTQIKFDTDADIVNTLGNTVYVGADYGYGELDVFGGAVRGGYYGTLVGCQYSTAAADNCVTGVLRVAGGSYTQDGSYYSQGEKLLGTIIGDGAVVNSAAPSDAALYHGLLELSGGAYTNVSAWFVVGVGPQGIGSMVQTGGDIYHKGGSSSTTIMGVGLAGGAGSIVVSNGTFTTAAALYVGGAPYAVMNTTGKLTQYPVSVRGGTGSFEVSGGTVAVKKSLVCGADGNGIIKIGPSGTLSAMTLALSNSVDVAVTRSSKVVFEAGENGVGTIDLASGAGAGELIVEDGAKLEVDFSKWENAQGKVPLITWKKKTGGFAEKDISVKGNFKLREMSVGGVAGLYACPQKGLVITVQ